MFTYDRTLHLMKIITLSSASLAFMVLLMNPLEMQTVLVCMGSTGSILNGTVHSYGLCIPAAWLHSSLPAY